MPFVCIRRRSKSFASRVGGITFMLLLCVSVSRSQTERPERIAVDTPWPLAHAAEELARKYHWLVAYEDPIQRYPADLVPIPEKTGYTHLVPRREKLSISFPLGRGGSSPSPDAVLRKLAKTYAETMVRSSTCAKWDRGLCSCPPRHATNRARSSMSHRCSIRPSASFPWSVASSKRSTR